MKRNKIIFWSLMLLMPAIFTTIGCKKFLDRKPLSATLDDLSKGQGALEPQSRGLYYVLRTYAGFSSLPWIDFHSVRDDDAQKGSDANDGKEINTEFETFVYTKDDWATNTYWNDHYTMINQANDEIFTGDSLKLTDIASLRNLAEARFFRAYSFFELVKAYGQVPLINYHYTRPIDGVRNKSTIDSLYMQIDSDLVYASTYLPLNSSAYGDGFDGRLTSGAANTLHAQTFLFRAKWDSVIKYTNIVINSGQYKLDSNFSHIWKDGVGSTSEETGKNGPESIFEMQANSAPGSQANSTLDNGTNWGTSQQVRQNGAPQQWNLGWGWNTPTDKLVGDWDNTDPRKARTILYSGKYDGGPALGGYGDSLPAYTDPLGNGGLAQKYWNKKLYSDKAKRASTGFINKNGAANWINHRILRYADVLLMLAEAANEKGDGPTAEANLEKVRFRARMGDTTGTVLPMIHYTGHDAMATAIQNERRWEFALEGYRFYDLVRWGKASSVLGSLGYTDRCQYYPIPQPAIDLSGKVLQQNPLWP